MTPGQSECEPLALPKEKREWTPESESRESWRMVNGLVHTP